MQALKYVTMVVWIVVPLLAILWMWVHYGPQLVSGRRVHSSSVIVPHHK
jgi:hypothetical protein